MANIDLNKEQMMNILSFINSGSIAGAHAEKVVELKSILEKALKEEE